MIHSLDPLRRTRFASHAPLAAAALLLVFGTWSAAQSVRTTPSPRASLLRLPDGVRIEYPADERVQTVDKAGRPAIARVYLRAGATVIVLLPDGTLVQTQASKLAPTERPFKAIGKGDLIERLKKAFPEMDVRAAKGYVFVSNTSETFREVTERILTTMLPGIRRYAKKQKIATHDPEFPLVVLMFRTRAEFDRHKRVAKEIAAYYSPWTNHIVLYEETPMFRVNRQAAIGQTLSTIAHEGVHQILHNIGVQARLSKWPMWLSEGMAEYFAPTQPGKRFRWKGAGTVNDLRMLELEIFIKAKAFDAEPGSMIAQTVGATRLTSTGYASAWALTHYLATRQATTFDDLLRDLVTLRPLETVGTADGKGRVPANLELFHKYFGEDDVKTERQLLRHLQRLPYRDPFAQFPKVVAVVRYRHKGRAMWRGNVFPNQSSAEAWSRGLMKRLDEDARPQATLRVVPNRRAGEILLRQLGGG